MFNGDYKVRQVSLAGRSRTRNVKDIVEEANRERKQRNYVRLQLRAATLIQSNWRGCRARKTLVSSEISRLQTRINDTIKARDLITSRGKIFYLPMAPLTQLLRSFSIIQSPLKIPTDTLTLLLELVLSTTSETVPPGFHLQTYFDVHRKTVQLSPEQWQFVLYLSRLLIVSISHIEKSIIHHSKHGGTKFDPAALSNSPLFLRFLELFQVVLKGIEARSSRLSDDAFVGVYEAIIARVFASDAFIRLLGSLGEAMSKSLLKSEEVTFLGNFPLMTAIIDSIKFLLHRLDNVSGKDDKFQNYPSFSRCQQVLSSLVLAFPWYLDTPAFSSLQSEFAKYPRGWKSILSALSSLLSSQTPDGSSSQSAGLQASPMQQSISSGISALSSNTSGLALAQEVAKTFSYPQSGRLVSEWQDANFQRGLQTFLTGNKAAIAILTCNLVAIHVHCYQFSNEKLQTAALFTSCLSRLINNIPLTVFSLKNMSRRTALVAHSRKPKSPQLLQSDDSKPLTGLASTHLLAEMSSDGHNSVTSYDVDPELALFFKRKSQISESILALNQGSVFLPGAKSESDGHAASTAESKPGSYSLGRQDLRLTSIGLGFKDAKEMESSSKSLAASDDPLTHASRRSSLASCIPKPFAFLNEYDLLLLQHPKLQSCLRLLTSAEFIFSLVHSLPKSELKSQSAPAASNSSAAQPPSDSWDVISLSSILFRLFTILRMAGCIQFNKDASSTTTSATSSAPQLVPIASFSSAEFNIRDLANISDTYTAHLMNSLTLSKDSAASMADFLSFDTTHGDAAMDIDSTKVVSNSESFLFRLWSVIRTHPTLQHFTSRDATAASTLHPDFASTLSLFLLLLSYALEHSPDKLFTSQDSLLPYNSVTEITKIIVNLLYRLCWTDKSALSDHLSQRPELAIALISFSSTSFNSLVDLHLRKSIQKKHDLTASWPLQDSDFHWPSIPLRDLTAEVLTVIGNTRVDDRALQEAEQLANPAIAQASAHALVSSSATDTSAREAGAMEEDEGDELISMAVRSARIHFVLTTIPQVIPFNSRLEIFNLLKAQDMRKRGLDFRGFLPSSQRVSFQVRRTNLFEDACAAFEDIAKHSVHGSKFKERFHIVFVNAEGTAEAGIDGGGLLKEFIDCVTREAFNPARGLFKTTEDHFVYPNPDSEQGSTPVYRTVVPLDTNANAAAAASTQTEQSFVPPVPDSPFDDPFLEDASGIGSFFRTLIGNPFDSFLSGGVAPPRSSARRGGGSRPTSSARFPSPYAEFSAARGGMGVSAPTTYGNVTIQAEEAPEDDMLFPLMGRRFLGRQAEPAQSARREQPGIRVSVNHLDQFSFLGRLLGKALYDGVLIGPRFAHFVLCQLLGRATNVHDLESYDRSLYRSLITLRDQSERYRQAAAKEQLPDPVRNLDLDFTFTFEKNSGGPGGVIREVRPLIPNGDKILVTSYNIDEYIQLIAKAHLQAVSAKQVRAFLKGFREIVPLSWIHMFSPQELGKLLSGDQDREIDVEDWRRYTVYGVGYHPDHPVIRTFWSVVEKLPQKDLQALLSFTTSVPRPPLLGFSALTPKFGISKVDLSGTSGDILPSASTCMNLLKLPTYTDENLMRQKLLYSIHSGAGFELT